MRIFFVFLMTSLFSVGCETITSTFKSPAEQLIDARFKQKSELDALYTEYGGGTLAQNIEANSNDAEKSLKPEEEGIKGFLNVLKNTVKETDRDVFDTQCIDLGSGKDVNFLSEKARNFFAQSTTLDKCKNIALIQVKIASLEQQVAQTTPAENPK